MRIAKKYASLGVFAKEVDGLKQDLILELKFLIRTLKSADPLLKQKARVAIERSKTEPGTEELIEALELFAPPYARLEINNSEIGYFANIEEAMECDSVKKINAGDSWPYAVAQKFDYILEINDHGNVTLFATRGRKKEIWAVV